MPGPASVNMIVEGAYNEWRSHHERCAHCSQEDWYNPGFPRKVTADDRYDAILETPQGPTYWVNGPDVSVLCTDGKRFFKNWVRAATLHVAEVF